MEAPTAADVRTWSLVDFGQFGLPAASPDPLQEYVDRALAFLGGLTGRGCDPLEDTINIATGTGPLAGVPLQFEPMYRQATQRMVEILVMSAQEEVVQTLGDFMLLSAFSAGSYSETRRSLTELSKSQMLVADPGLNSLLWMLMTPEMRSFWMAWLTGQNAPSFGYEENVPQILGWPRSAPAVWPWPWPVAVDWGQGGY